MGESLFEQARNAPEQGGGEAGVMSVTRLNALVKNNLELAFGEVTVRGEVSNLRMPASGHRYFTLKDQQAEIQAVWFRAASLKSAVKLEEGREITAAGRVSLYEQRGTYQLIVRSIASGGKGDLRARFEKLLEKLRQEGLFEESRKKTLPRLPAVIGVITSRTGAAVKDITNMIWNRFPGAHVVLGAVAVQGDQAAGEISRMLDLFNAWGGADVLIVGRGGGSLEDLWAFNEEEVARAIARSRIPVISAVGHEIDVTIADLVADARALTPTRAGEMAAPDAAQENQLLDGLLERGRLAMQNILRSGRSELDFFRSHRIFALPETTVRLRKQEVLELARTMQSAARTSAGMKREQIKRMEDVLASLNPLAVLKRGFSYTEDSSGRRLTDAAALAPGDRIVTRLHRGTVRSDVTDVHPDGST